MNGNPLKEAVWRMVEEVLDRRLAELLGIEPDGKAKAAEEAE